VGSPAEREAVAKISAKCRNSFTFGEAGMSTTGALGVVSAMVSAATFAVTGHWSRASTAAGAVVLLLAWLVLYVRVSAPVNRRLTDAATSGRVPTNARALQSSWDRVIVVRAVLQGLALTALCVTLIV
jgi:hypothetical protein